MFKLNYHWAMSQSRDCNSYLSTKVLFCNVCLLHLVIAWHFSIQEICVSLPGFSAISLDTRREYTFNFTKEPWKWTIYLITKDLHLKTTVIKPPTEATALGVNQTLFDPTLTGTTSKKTDKCQVKYTRATVTEIKTAKSKCLDHNKRALLAISYWIYLHSTRLENVKR